MTPTDCFQRAFEALERAGWRPRLTGEGRVQAFCRIHGDKKPSVKLKQTSSGVLLTCFAGCLRADVMKELGLTFGDVLVEQHVNTATKRRIEAVYVYEDELGRPVAEKVRYRPKGFVWRRPAGSDTA